ncbi:MAG: FG-GAP-like repeat-containing protein [Planctomycetaceae bacterium]
MPRLSSFLRQFALRSSGLRQLPTSARRAARQRRSRSSGETARLVEAMEARALLAADFTFQLSELNAGQADNTITVNVPDAPASGGIIDGWIDVDGDGQYLSQGEHVLSHRSVGRGITTVAFEIPATAIAGSHAARFTVTTSDPDVHTLNQGVVIQRWTGSPQFAVAAEVDYEPFLNYSTVGDLDGDGDMDVVASWITGAHFYWLENDGSGNFTEHVVSTDNFAGVLQTLHLADMDNDGLMDIVTGRSVSDTMEIYYQTAPGVFYRVTTTTGEDSDFLKLADFNGDGLLDILIANDSVRVLMNDGHRGFTEVVLDNVNRFPRGVAVGDIDGDGDIDAISNETRSIHLYRNDGSGQFTTVSDFITVSQSIDISQIVDVDGDGRADILASGFLSQNVRWFRNTDTGFVETATDIPGHSVEFHVLDFDGDGDNDYLSATNLRGAELFLNSGDNASFSPIAIHNSGAPNGISVADMNGDGAPDVVSDILDGIAWFRNTGVSATTGTIRLTTATTTVAENIGSVIVEVSRPPGASTAADLSVTLSSSSPTVATVPGTVTIPAGQASVMASVSIVDDTIQDGDQTVVITASAVGAGAKQLTLTVTDDESGSSASSGTLRGRVWNDLNFNGTDDAGEPALSGIQVYLDQNGNGSLDAQEVSVQTNSAGEYVFQNVAPGQYLVRQVLASAQDQTAPSTYVGLKSVDNATELFYMTPQGIVFAAGQPTGVYLYSLIQTNDGRLFATSFDTDSLYEIDPVTGQETLIGQADADLVGGLAYDSATDTIYTLGRPSTDQSGNRLLTIDRQTGAVTAVGGSVSGLTGTSSLAFDASSQRIIAFDNADDEFYAFDLSGQGTLLSTAASPIDSWGMTYRGDTLIMQQLNVSSNQQLISMNPDTGQFQPAFQASQSIPAEALDYVSRGNTPYRVTVTAGATAAGLNFGQYTGPLVLPAGFTVTESDGSTEVTEGGSSDSVSVRLSREPASSVVINVTLEDAAGQARTSLSRLVFNPTNWNVAQNLSVNAIEDVFADGNQTLNLTFEVNAGLSDDDFDSLTPKTISVDVIDNDVAGIQLSQQSITVTEPGTQADLTAVLTAAPLTDVVVRVRLADASEATASPETLTFTSANWNTPQKITVTAVDDHLADGPISQNLTVSVNTDLSDAAFDQVAAQTVEVTTQDNDVTEIVVSDSQLVVSESGTAATFTVSLASRPAGDVVLNLTPSPLELISLDQSVLTFSADHWDDPQTVTVTGLDNHRIGVNPEAVIRIQVDPDNTSDDFDSASVREVRVQLTDDETASIVVNHDSISVSEDGTHEGLQVTLSARPEMPVTIHVERTDSTEVDIAPELLTFSPETWNQPQVVTVTGRDDQVIDGNISSTVRLSVVTADSDPEFADAPAREVSVLTRDNDVAGFSVSPHELTVSESGTQSTFQVVLNAPPSTPVVLSIIRRTVGEVRVDPNFLTFTPENWSVPQTVIVTGVDDFIHDGDQFTEIDVRVVPEDSNTAFESLTVSTVRVRTEDNDQIRAHPSF